MSNNNPTQSNWKYTSIAILFIVVVAILLFQAEDKLKISLLLLTASLALLRPHSFRQWTMVDGCLCLITAYDVISCLHAACTTPAISYSLFSLFCLTAYFVLRRLFGSAHATRLLQQGSYLPVGAALLLAISSFWVFRQSVLGAGFQDTYHFRFLFRPLGYITNVWAEVLLILLGWVCLVRKYSGIFIFLTVLAILFSFSRGAYIALGVYMITWLLFVKPKREKIRLLAVSIVAILLTGIFFPNEMRTTLQMNHTTSQQQSTEGRITATQVGWETFRQRPIFGCGNGNYTFAVDQTLNQDITHSYTSYAPNILVQLLIEKGIIGSLLYLLLALAVCRTILKRRKQPESYMIGCLFLALAVKEMTQATLLYTPFAMFMVYVILAFLQKEKISIEEENRQTVSAYTIPGIVALCYLGSLAFVFIQNQDKSYQQQSIIAWEKGLFTEAIRLMEQTKELTPNLINRGLLYMQYYHKTANPQYQQVAEEVLQKARQQQPEDIQIRYLQARLYIDNKALGKARQIIEELATDYPKNSLYLSALSDILYQQGEKEAALQPLVNAIRYTPRLLTGKRIRLLRQNDPAFYNTLLERLSALSPTPEDIPTDYARYGYIARWCGNKSVSDEYLRKALNALPNLATPWHLLGDDNKYRLLLYGAFQKDLLSTKLPEEKEMSDEHLFNMFYQPRFRNWYGGDLYVLWYETAETINANQIIRR